ncbi:MAG: hypothetical protein K0R46_2281 [Herbinix sp.]|jgi:hypothetical protein|nr:hypothetical protein [Herbinix sp.]
MKKNYLFVLILTTFWSLNSLDYAMAATGLSEAEQMILNKLEAGVEIDGEMSYLSVSYLNQAENELIKNEIDITVEQAGAIIKKIDEVLAVISGMSLVDITNLQGSEAAFQLLTLIDEAAKEIDYEVSIDISDRSVNIRNPEGDTVFVASNGINQTGAHSIPRLEMGLLFLWLLIICCAASVVVIMITGKEKQELQRWQMNNKGIGMNHEK